MQPRPEIVHWMFGVGFLTLGLCLLAELVVGVEVWRRRRWRACLWPTFVFLIGVFMWPVTVLFTNSTIHMLAHCTWAQVAMLAGAAELGVVAGRLKSRAWPLTLVLAFTVGGATLLLHEENGWLWSRSAFLHHALGWLFVAAAIFPLARTFRPRSVLANAGFAVTFVAFGVLLFAHRDRAPIFGHLSDRPAIEARR
jgi:hypothetical protein